MRLCCISLEHSPSYERREFCIVRHWRRWWRSYLQLVTSAWPQDAALMSGLLHIRGQQSEDSRKRFVMETAVVTLILLWLSAGTAQCRDWLRVLRQDVPYWQAQVLVWHSCPVSTSGSFLRLPERVAQHWPYAKTLILNVCSLPVAPCTHSCGVAYAQRQRYLLRL
jgi:hypothetical protein